MSRSAKPNGFTLVEMSTTIVVIGIIGLGLTMTLRTTFLHYSTDFVRQEIRQYGNIVMRELNERISYAQKVDFDVFNGFARIMLWDDASNATPSEIIRASLENGILLNNEPLLSGTLHLPKTGRFRDNNQHRVSLISFQTQQAIDPRPSLKTFNDAMIDIDLVLGLESSVYTSGETTTEQFYFNRAVFIANNYISDLN
jgi:prepilin-type N-terminal cleavage/methylation domain-containing protein